MVKREKSPEIEEDVRLYVAWMPYPLNANLEIKDDRKACVEWVIEIIGNEHLMNIYQKPSVRSISFLFLGIYAKIFMAISPAECSCLRSLNPMIKRINAC